MVAGTALALVYVIIGLLGAKMDGYGSFDNGTAVLSTAATLLLGNAGKALLGLIFTLACFTTCVGLTISCGKYFSKIEPKLSYRLIVTVVTLGSLLISNLGLNQIITITVPFLAMAYPLTIVLVTLSIFHRYIGKVQKVYAGAMLLTGIVSVLDGLKMFGLKWGPLESLLGSLPLSSVGLDWVVPALVGILGGLVLERFRPTSTSERDLSEKAS
jgi:LIVCS family branched-chain amino acid:cation transporter